MILPARLTPNRNRCYALHPTVEIKRCKTERNVQDPAQYPPRSSGNRVTITTLHRFTFLKSVSGTRATAGIGPGMAFIEPMHPVDAASMPMVRFFPGVLDPRTDRSVRCEQPSYRLHSEKSPGLFSQSSTRVRNTRGELPIPAGTPRGETRERRGLDHPPCPRRSFPNGPGTSHYRPRFVNARSSRRSDDGRP